MTGDKRHKPDTTRLEQLYRQAADAEPESRIDQAVLGEARIAASSPRRRALRHPGAWGTGLAAAASLVLAVGLVFQYGWQPTSGSGNLKQLRDRAEMEPADKPSAAAAGESRKLEDAGEPATIRESAELERAQVTGAPAREEVDRDGQEDRKTGENEAGMAAPPPVEKGEQLTPEAWLERIRALAEAGNVNEARQEMQNFRDAHPSVKIPVEIQEALTKEFK